MPAIALKNKYLVISLLVLVLFAVSGSPYRFADKNNGRYLPNLYRAMDAELFPSDPLVDAFARFESLFYSGLGIILGSAQISLLQVESVFYGIYVFSKVVLMILLLVLIRSLKQGVGAFLLLGAWAVHQKAASVGGDSMFAPHTYPCHHCRFAWYARTHLSFSSEKHLVWSHSR